MVGSKKQNILLLTVICCATLALISITWAAFSSTLKLSGQASVTAQSWDIDFTNTVGTKWTTAQTLTGTKTNLAELPTSSSGAFGLPLDQTASGFLGSLRMSGDKITYTWYVQNFGTFEAKYSISGLISTSKYLSGSNVDITCNTSDNSTDKTFCNNYVKTTLTIDGVVADASSSYTLAKAGQTGDSSTLVLTIEIIGENQIYTATAGAFESRYSSTNPSMLLGGIEMLDSSNDLNISVKGLSLSGTQSVAETSVATTVTKVVTTSPYNQYIGETDTFSSNNSYQTFTAEYPGYYKIELWGAQGGTYDETYYGGLGGYTAGTINLNKDDTLYIYIGKQGDLGSSSGAGGGYNGGGNAYICSESYCSKNRTGGGGATDVRLVSGSWNNFDSLKSRIMVAAGGGGIAKDTESDTGYSDAGGLIGYTGIEYSSGTGGTQTSGGKYYSSFNGSSWNGSSGSFGYGGYGGSHAGGGGGGYYGGAGGSRDSSKDGAGGGGSSFISGHDGCDAIAESSTSSNIIHTGQSIHYSNQFFINTSIIDGAGYSWTDEKNSLTGMPNHDGTSTMIGNSGDGYAKITYLGESI